MAILTALVVILEPIGVLKLTPLVRFLGGITTIYDHVPQIFSENDQYRVGRWSLDPPLLIVHMIREHVESFQ